MPNTGDHTRPYRFSLIAIKKYSYLADKVLISISEILFFWALPRH